MPGHHTLNETSVTVPLATSCYWLAHHWTVVLVLFEPLTGSVPTCWSQDKYRKGKQHIIIQLLDYQMFDVCQINTLILHHYEYIMIMYFCMYV